MPRRSLLPCRRGCGNALPGVTAVPLLPAIQRGVFLAYRKGERDHPAVNVFLDEAVYTADKVLG